MCALCKHFFTFIEKVLFQDTDFAPGYFKMPYSLRKKLKKEKKKIDPENIQKFVLM